MLGMLSNWERANCGVQIQYPHIISQLFRQRPLLIISDRIYSFYCIIRHWHCFQILCVSLPTHRFYNFLFLQWYCGFIAFATSQLTSKDAFKARSLTVIAFLKQTSCLFSLAYLFSKKDQTKYSLCVVSKCILSQLGFMLSIGRIQSRDPYPQQPIAGHSNKLWRPSWGPCTALFCSVLRSSSQEMTIIY